MKSRRSELAGGITLTVRVQPRSSKNEICLRPDGSIKVRLTAPPVDGAANDALIAVLARQLGVSRSQVEILSGHTAREKRVRISGITADDLERVLNSRTK